MMKTKNRFHFEDTIESCNTSQQQKQHLPLVRNIGNKLSLVQNHYINIIDVVIPTSTTTTAISICTTNSTPTVLQKRKQQRMPRIVSFVYVFIIFLLSSSLHSKTTTTTTILAATFLASSSSSSSSRSSHLLERQLVHTPYLQHSRSSIPVLSAISFQNKHLSDDCSTTENTDTLLSSNLNLKNSNNSNNNNSSSPSKLGVRKRVRDVLEKAKIRTGLSNQSSRNVNNNNAKSPSSTIASIVAETASIGGLYESTNFVVNTNSNNNNVNGYTTTSNILNNNNNNGITKKNGISITQALQEVQGSNGTDIGGMILETQIINNNNDISKSATTTTTPKLQVDAILNRGTMVETLPFTLPKLSIEQKEQLVLGERIQEQSKMGRDGSGYVVLDVKAPDYVVWECLLDFEKYPEYIGTVRSMQMFTNTHLKQSYIAEQPVLPGTGRETRHYGKASITRASFVLSKFQLKIAAIHQYKPHPAGHYMEFTLDKACKNVVLRDAKGIWYTQSNPDGRVGYTRIWLLCELSVAPVLPTFIVDYAAKRAMPRASNWIKPIVEQVKKEFNIMD